MSTTTPTMQIETSEDSSWRGNGLITDQRMQMQVNGMEGSFQNR